MKNYTLKELVGKGGFGDVYLAKSKKDGKQAVVKEKFDLTSFRPILLVKNFTVYFCQTRTSALKLRVWMIKNVRKLLKSFGSCHALRTSVSSGKIELT